MWCYLSTDWFSFAVLDHLYFRKFCWSVHGFVEILHWNHSNQSFNMPGFDWKFFRRYFNADDLLDKPLFHVLKLCIIDNSFCLRAEVINYASSLNHRSIIVFSCIWRCASSWGKQLKIHWCVRRHSMVLRLIWSWVYFTSFVYARVRFPHKACFISEISSYSTSKSLNFQFTTFSLVFERLRRCMQ